MPQNFYELVWIFIIYAFIGWCTEVSYAALNRGIFVNRGFLNGPYCPIYGCGVVIVVTVLTPLKDNLIILFTGSFLLTSILEYVTGFILEKVFHNKWWDYSSKPFNLHGYVCLKFSIYWGLACTFIMDILHPIIYQAITKIPFVLGVIFLSLFMTVFAADCFITVTTILKFNRKLKVMDEMAAKIHKLSDEIGENIYEGVSTAVEKSEEFQETHEELLTKISDTKENLLEIPANAKEKLTEAADETKAKIVESTENGKARITESANAARARISESTEAGRLKIAESASAAKAKITESTGAAREKLAEYKDNRELSRMEKQREKEALEKKYEEMLRQKDFGFKRLLKAFPDMTSRNQNETLERYKKYFSIRKSDDEKNE